MKKFDLQAFIANAIREDIGDGDHTSLACIPVTTEKSAKLLCKENGILAGMEIAEAIFRYIDPALVFSPLLKDGDQVKKGDIAFEVSGPARSILMAERLVLNCMQRMSGIATTTRQLVDLLKDSSTRILDTRKTTPCFRALEKQAVKTGGGENHRFGLYDMIMIKDNHIDSAGGIAPAISAVRKYLAEKQLDLKVEIETRNMEELEEVLAIGQVDRIMLDNFSPAGLKAAVEKIGGRYETEASGGITAATIAEYAKSGVDFISVGALTHHVKSLDMSLKAI